jgi:hypothetical protein
MKNIIIFFFVNIILYVFRWATKLAIVGGATVLVVNHDVFGANKYTQQITNKIRTSLPDTAEAFDQIPTSYEINSAVTDTWNSGEYIKISFFTFYILTKSRRSKSI